MFANIPNLNDELYIFFLILLNHIIAIGDYFIHAFYNLNHKSI